MAKTKAKLRIIPIARKPALSAVAFVLIGLTGCYGPPPPAATFPPRGGEVIEPLFEDRTSTLPKASNRRSMEARAADFDGDGDLDILVAREESPNALLLNDGQGFFSDASDRLPPESSAHDHEDIAVADFDGDGDLDAIVSAEDDELKDFYLNDGQANFSSVSDRLPQHCKSNAVAAADFDADGDVDVVFGCAGNDLLLINDGTGHFRNLSSNISEGDNWRDITQDVAIGDLDADGDLDLVLANEDDNRLLLNDGHARFSDAPAGALPLRQWSRAAQILGRFEEESRNVDLGDVDGDGDLDILFSNVGWEESNNPQDRLLLNDGHGRFEDTGTSRIPKESLTTIAGSFFDLEADGDLDIVTIHTMPGESHRLLINSGRGIFADMTDRYLPASLVGDGIEVEVADFNGDKRPDMYICGHSTFDQLLIRIPWEE